MFYKLSTESYEKIKSLIGKDSPDDYKSLYKIKERKITKEQNYSEQDLNTIISKFGLTSSNLIGKGLFSIVYEKDSLIYKFTMNRPDILKTLLFKSLKNKLPEQYKKFILQIEDFGFDEETKFYYIITEKLYNLQKIEMSLLKGNESPIEQQFVASTLITDKFVTFCLEQFKTLPSLLETINKILDFPSTKNLLMSEIVNNLNNISFINIDSKDKEDIKIKNISVNSKRFASEVAATIAKFIRSKFNVKLELDEKYLAIVKKIAINYLDSVSLPSNYLKDNLKFDKSRYGGDLMEFLRYIKDNHNILFKDLHLGNIMKRVNGDLVLSDVGLFKIK